MRALSFAAGVLALAFSSGALANHKPSHPKPPAHVKLLEKPGAQLAASSTQGDASALRADTWGTYVDDRYGFSVDLPIGLFNPVEKNARGISLRAPRYGAVIDVYASENPNGFDPEQFVTEIENADRVREVTYRAAGKSWFVLSGFYSKTEAGDAVIFYTKFMFSADRSRLTAFEISFPAREKPRFASVVERIEDSFTNLSR